MTSSSSSELPPPTAPVTPALLLRLHAEHFGLVYRYARWRLGDDRAAQEVVIAAFSELLKVSQGGRLRVGGVQAWLLTTVSKRIGVRRWSDPMRLDLPRAVLQQLTAGEQHFLGLRFGVGFSLEETAALLKLTPAAAKQRQARALTSLRRAQWDVGA